MATNPEWLHRAESLLPAELAADTTVAVYGLGAVGSFACLALSKTGFAVVGFDFDVVTPANVGPQLFAPADADAVRTKAAAVAANPYLLGNVKTFQRRVRAPVRADVHLLAVDSIAVRRTLVEKLPDGAYCVDVRMAATARTVIAFESTPENRKRWVDECWFPPEEAMEEVCTAKATVWNAMACAADAARLAFLMARKQAPAWSVLAANEHAVFQE